MVEKLKIFRAQQVFYKREIRTLRAKIEDYLINHPDAPLLICGDTWGGVGSDTITAANAFRELRGGRITTYVAEECWSAGLLLLACADRRVALRGVQFMIHSPMMRVRGWKAEAQQYTHFPNMRNILENAEANHKNYFAYLDQRTGMEPGFWRDKAQPEPENRYYSADEMKDFGMVTHIVDSFDEMREIALQA